MKFIVVFLVLTFSLSTNASRITGKIENISISGFSGGKALILVKANGAVEGSKPTCSTNTNYNFAFNGSTDEGKAMYSAILAAQSAGKEIYLNGSGSCSTDLYETLETLAQVVTQP